MYLITAVLSLLLVASDPAGVQGEIEVITDGPIEWLTEQTVDVGNIPRGENHYHSFDFRNVTSDSLWVDNVRVGCGCTATDWIDSPVAPGEVGSINVTFDATNVGYFRKYVKVYFVDHRGGHKLWLEGFVE